MLKNLFLLLFFAFAVSSIAADLPNRRVFIEGTARRQEHLEFFLRNFNTEARGTGYSLTDHKEDAGYIFNFDVFPNMDSDIDGNQNVLKIRLINNMDNSEILSFNFFFTELEEAYQYNQLLFLRAVSLIPPLTERDIVIIQNIIVDARPETPIVNNNSWKNKWLYFRLSLDYPVTFFRLQPAGLAVDENGRKGVYYGSIDNPARFLPENNKVITLPGWTMGFEAQFFNNMSLELNLQMSLGDTRRNSFLNIAAGAQLKFPIKYFDNFMIVPYGAFTYPLLISDVFSNFPPFTAGGGIQIGTKADNRGAFFIDINYMFSFTDAAINNTYELFPNPQTLHYRRHVLGLGIGYKIGLRDRSQVTESPERIFYF